MFVFKAVNKKKHSKTHCYVDQYKRPEWFIAPVSKQKFYSRAHIKMFFLPLLFCSFLMSGYTAANVDGDYNIGGHDGLNISAGDSELSGTGGFGNQTLTIGEIYGNNDTTISAAGKTASTKFSCSDVKSKSSREICEEFLKDKHGRKYKVQYLDTGKLIKGRAIEPVDFIRENESNTVYILPKADIWFKDVIKISGANIAIIGEADADGSYPTLKGGKKNSTMIEWENCQHCMLANINIDPATGNAHSLPVNVSGDHSEIEFKNISATHSRTGLLNASSAKLITLENVKTTFEPETRHTRPPILSGSAITLHNCAKIKAKNVVVHNVILSSEAVYPNVIDILNPVDIDFEDIYISLAEGASMSRDMAYIGLVFSDMGKYAQPDGFVVKGVMKGLHFGVYTGGNAPGHVTVPDNWPTNRHVLSLSERTIYPADTTEVTGRIAIQSNDNLQAIANKPGVDTVTGDDLFHNLEVSFPGLISPTINLLTQSQRQSSDDSGYSLGDQAGMVVGGLTAAVVAGALLALGYKKRVVLKACFMSFYKAVPRRIALMRYEQGPYTQNLVDSDSSDEEDQYTVYTKLY